MSLETLLQRADLWRGGHPTAAATAVASHHPELDALLPGGGWPQGALTEIQYPQEGLAEVSLVLPTLAALSRQGRRIAWVAPPHLPYAPALQQAGLDLRRFLLIRAPDPGAALWALEQTLRSGACAAVLGWPTTADHRALRRLQLAAEAGDCLAFIFLLQQQAPHTSPAALRLRLHPGRVEILKRRGGWPVGPLALSGHAVA